MLHWITILAQGDDMFSRSILNRVVGACGLFISVFALAACDSDPTPTVKATENARIAPDSGGDVDRQMGRQNDPSVSALSSSASRR